MNIRETKKTTICFDANDKLIIERLIIEQVGKRTVEEIMNEMSYVFGWYAAMMSMVKKIFSGWYVALDSDEINVLSHLFCKAYNSDTEPEKEAIKKMANAIGTMKDELIKEGTI